MNNNNPFEKQIKVAVLNKLIEDNVITEKTIIINELVIDSFSRRADLVLINKNSITAFEIKSEADSLVRLTGQVEKYLLYFDKVIVVTTNKHIEKIIKSVPQQVGVWQFNKDNIIKKNRGKKESIPEKNNYLDFLKVNELKKLAKNSGLILKNNSKTKIKEELKSSLNKASINNIKNFTIEMLKNRYSMPSNLFVSSVLLKNKVDTNDFELLKPYIQKKSIIDPLFPASQDGESDDSFLETLAKESALPIFGGIPEKIKKLI